MTRNEAIDKARKLLALANGAANEHEAAAAAARAADIMERYRLEAAMVAEAEQRQTEADDEPFSMNDAEADMAERRHSRIPTWYWTIAWAAAISNRCKPHSRWEGDGRRITFAGRPSDAATARYMLDALANEVDRLAVAFVARCSGKRVARSAGKSFRLGAACVIDQRLTASARETTERIRGELQAAADPAALVRLDNAIALRERDAKRLDQYVEANGVHYRSAGPLSVSNRDAFKAGAAAGREMRLQGGTAALGSGARALTSGGSR